MKQTEELIQLMLDAGASKAARIEEAQIVTNPAFFDTCKTNRCGNFGKCYACPPLAGSCDELIKSVHSYRHGLLYQTIGYLEDSFDIEGMGAAGRKHAETGMKIREALSKELPEDAWFLSAGGCRLCDRCAALDGSPCRFPDKVQTAMEGACIDVFQTTKSTPLKYINGQDTVTYFGLVLFDRKDEGTDV